MKRLAAIAIVLVPALMWAERIYRADGSSFALERVEGITASLEKSAAPDAATVKIWRSGDGIYRIAEAGGGMPVYRYGGAYFIARPEIFWRGDGDPRRLARDFGLTLVEILPSYRLYKFTTSGDAVAAARMIVESDRGFAFPNLVREVRPRLSLPQDEFYAEYQWERHNRGFYNDAYGNPVETLPRADIRFEDALRFLMKIHFEPAKYATPPAVICRSSLRLICSDMAFSRKKVLPWDSGFCTPIPCSITWPAHLQHCLACLGGYTFDRSAYCSRRDLVCPLLKEMTTTLLAPMSTNFLTRPRPKVLWRTSWPGANWGALLRPDDRDGDCRLRCESSWWSSSPRSSGGCARLEPSS